MGVSLALLGAQLSISGAVLYLTHESQGSPDETGAGMIIFGVLIGIVAAFRDRAKRPQLHDRSPEDRA